MQIWSFEVGRFGVLGIWRKIVCQYPRFNGIVGYYKLIFLYVPKTPVFCKFILKFGV